MDLELMEEGIHSKSARLEAKAKKKELFLRPPKCVVWYCMFFFQELVKKGGWNPKLESFSSWKIPENKLFLVEIYDINDLLGGESST